MEEHNDKTDELRDDRDMGDPIAELRDLDEEVSAGFLGRVVSMLQRRSVVGHFATMAWTASVLAVFEFLGMIFSIFDTGNSAEKEDRTDG
ncbi:MAG: hypothetical protein HKO65_01380 [Gemmatimonadetes bacterium]|nr:hypothetical protein [Gemmatimonadota bacterium]NNM03725.1 hypothetical protein [Gemmatimonadota bacterium]